MDRAANIIEVNDLSKAYKSKEGPIEALKSLTLQIRKGEIFAQCQGTAPVPYRIKIRFQPLTSPQWDKIIMRMNSQIHFEASLLSGQMPININKIFVDVGVPLFPVPKKKWMQIVTVQIMRRYVNM